MAAKKKSSAKKSKLGKLTAAQRKRIPKKEFGLPGAKGAKAGKGKYPMPDKKHAAVAKAYAKKELEKGKLSKAQYDKIVAKANKKLGSSKGKSTAKRKTAKRR